MTVEPAPYSQADIIAVQNGFGFLRGRVALAALLKALNIGKGCAVAIQAFTCSALAEAVLSVGATPVWVDIEPDSFTMDADDLAKKISPQTKAIVIQHSYGIPASMDELCALAVKHNIPVIEDCCHTQTGHTIRGCFGERSRDRLRKRSASLNRTHSAGCDLDILLPCDCETLGGFLRRQGFCRE